MSAAAANAFAPIDFALRVCESVAFCLHGILGLTEPWTGCLRNAFQDGGVKGGMPTWFWPVAGALLLVIAMINFSNNDAAILAAQAYIAAFHSGAVFYHLTLGHHPASGVAPGFFVVIAFLVTWIRTNIWVAMVGTCVSVAIAKVLSKILVTPPKSAEDAGSAIDAQLLNPAIQ